MPQLQRLSLKAQVYEIIRQKILQQEYALGEKINIDTVADELKISNSPIREALMMLSQDGLIEMVPNNGARVISFSEEGYHEIASSLYVVLYGACEGNVPETVKYALQYDKCIVTGTKNSYLISMYEHIEDIFYLMALHSNQRGEDDRHNNFTEHKMILKSIQEHDAAALHKWLGIHYDKHL